MNTIRIKAGTRRRELELRLGSETALRLNTRRQQVALLKEMAVNKAMELGKHWVGHSRVWTSIMGNKRRRFVKVDQVRGLLNFWRRNSAFGEHRRYFNREGRLQSCAAGRWT